jgi:hypothetical protein
MSHEHETPTSGPGAGPTAEEPSATLRPEMRPDFLDRASRILSGDVRPDDYLPGTPEVEARVQRDLAFATDHIRKIRAAAVVEIDPSVPIRQRNDWLLSLYYGGQNIAYIENDSGVIVLAVGLEQGAALLDAFPYELRKDVGFGAPLPPDTITIL